MDQGYATESWVMNQPTHSKPELITFGINDMDSMRWGRVLKQIMNEQQVDNPNFTVEDLQDWLMENYKFRMVIDDVFMKGCLAGLFVVDQAAYTMFVLRYMK